MNRKFNLPVAMAVTVLGALPWPASAQAPPRNGDISSVWSSQNRSLHDVDLLTPRAFDELLSLPSVGLAIGATAPWGPDILTCEPQRSIEIDP
jgi:hypothetical protein